MQPERTYWGEVGVSAYVLDSTGVTWRVEGERADQVLLTGKDGGRVVFARPPDDTPVTRMLLEQHEAEALVEARLGAELMARHETGKTHICPILGQKNKVGTVAHLLLFHAHGVQPTILAPAAVAALHAEAHIDAERGDVSPGYVHHIHATSRPLGVPA